MSLCKSYKHYLSLVLALLFSNADNLAMETFHSVSWKVHTGRFMEIIYYKIRNVFFFWTVENFIFSVLIWILYRNLNLIRLMTKTTKCYLRPAKTQISLGIRPVWAESSLSAWRNIGSSDTNWAHSENSDRTGQMPRLIWVFAVRTGHIVGFVALRLIYWFCLS